MARSMVIHMADTPIRMRAYRENSSVPGMQAGAGKKSMTAAASPRGTRPVSVVRPVETHDIRLRRTGQPLRCGWLTPQEPGLVLSQSRAPVNVDHSNMKPSTTDKMSSPNMTALQ